VVECYCVIGLVDWDFEVYYFGYGFFVGFLV